MEQLDNQVEQSEMEVVPTEEEAKKESKVKTILGKVFSGIGLAVLAFLIVVVGWLSFQKFVLKDPVPSFAGYSHLIVTTGSMESEISAGDLIIIKDTGDYKNGDIITFMHEGETTPTTHRIIYTYGDVYVTKGDANNTADIISVHISEVYGEVVMIIPHLGLFIQWVKDGGGLIYLVGIILIIAAGIYIIKKE